jgi:hypothetical protein
MTQILLGAGTVALTPEQLHEFSKGGVVLVGAGHLVTTLTTPFDVRLGSGIYTPRTERTYTPNHCKHNKRCKFKRT